MSLQAQLKRFQKRQFFRFYMELSKPGIIAFINEKDKRVYLAGSQNVAITIASITRDLANKWHTNKALVRDRKKLQIGILELSDTSLDGQKLRVVSLADQYRAKGYTIYNETSVPKYTAKLKVTEDAKVHLVMETRGKRNLLVQEFSTYEEAEAYLNSHSHDELLSMALSK